MGVWHKKCYNFSKFCILAVSKNTDLSTCVYKKIPTFFFNFLADEREILVSVSWNGVHLFKKKI
jgi:hypothetical protein